jgi:hypothetical protein
LGGIYPYWAEARGNHPDLHTILEVSELLKFLRLFQLAHLPRYKFEERFFSITIYAYVAIIAGGAILITFIGYT